MFFKNKHVITSLIVAPILALISYYMVDFAVKEKPHVAVEGSSYPLRAKSNCRYTSGQCDLINESFKAKLIVEQDSQNHILKLTSSHPLEGVKVGFSTGSTQPESKAEQVQPSSMDANNNEFRDWTIKLPSKPTPETKLFIAMSANGAQYYAETTMEFSEYKTSFNENFRNDK